MKKIGIYFLSILLIVASLSGCSNKPKEESTVTEQKNTVMLFDESKTYENEKVESGKIVTQDVTIKNMTFEKDLIIDKEVGDGNVYLDGVEVKGNLIVNGGGENSIHLDNSKVNSISSNRPDGKVRIVVSENTSVDNLEIASETKLEVQGEVKSLSVTPTATGSVVEIKETATIKNVAVNATVDLSSKAPIEQLDIKAASKVNLEAPVTTVTISSSAQNTAISLGKDAVVSNLATETKVDVSGDGKLQTVITTDKTNITGNVKPDTTTVSTNPIQDTTNKDAPVTTPAPTAVATATPRPATPNPTVAPTPIPTPVPTSVPDPATPVPTPTYTIAFVLPGYTVSSQTVKQGNSALKPDITLDSSVIDGSYIVWLDENGKSFDFSSPISSNRTLTGEIAFKVTDEATLNTALTNSNIHTIGLEANIDLGNQGIEVNKDLTIYGNNKTIESNIELNGVLLVKESCLVKINEVNINATGNVSRGIYVDTDKNTTIEILNSTIKSSDGGITFNGTSVIGNTQQVNLLVKNSKLLNSKVTDYDTQVNYTTENASNAGNRGISLYDSVGTVNIENSEILGYKYSINVSGNNQKNEARNSLNLSVNNSTIKGWATFNVWGIHGEYIVKDSTLVGINNFTSGSNSFSTVVFNDDVYNIFDGNQAKFNKMTIENSTITNKQSQESLDSGVKQELIRVDCGLDEITFKGTVNLLDTSGKNTSAMDISEMNNSLVEDFITNKIKTNDARLTVTSNGKTIPLVVSPFTTVNIYNSQDLINAIANQKDMQIWKINSGNYDLTRNDTIEHLNQTGWFMPITANNIKIIGVGNPVITTSIDVENGNRSSQNLITIVGDNVSIDGVTIVAQRDPVTQIATNKAIEIFGDGFVLKNSIIKPHNDISTYAGSIYLSNPNKTTTLENVDLYYGRISTSGANDKSKLILNDVLIDFAYSSSEKAPYFGFSNTVKTIVEANNCILTVANLVGKDLEDQKAMLPTGMTIDKKESTMGVKNLEVIYTQASENIVVKYDLPVGFTFDLPKVKDVTELAGPYEKIFTGNDDEKNAAADIIGNDIIMYYYYKDSNNGINPLLTVNGNALVKNKLWGGHLNYYNEDGKTTTKLETGTVIKDTYLGVEIPSHKKWTTSTNPTVDPATVSKGWLNAAKGNELFVTIAVICDGKVYISDASISIPEDPNTPWDGTTKDTSWYNASSTSFTIKNAAQLAGLAQLVNEGNTFEGRTITLANDIDLSNHNWTPIGTTSNYFMGIFDGNNKVVSNLTCLNENSDLGTGLFGYMTTPGVIKNTTINNANLIGKAHVGAIVGSYNTGNIDNCVVQGHIEIIGNYKVAGLAGQGYGTVSNSKIDVDSASFVKGIYTNETQREGDNVGGLVGFTGELGKTASMINNCSSNVNVEGTRKVGGLVGFLSNGVGVNDSFSTGNVSSNASEEYIATNNISIGGLIGEVVGTNEVFTLLENCSASGTVTGPSVDKIGALVGFLRDDATIVQLINCTWSQGLSEIGNGHLIDETNKYTRVLSKVAQPANIELEDNVILPVVEEEQKELVEEEASEPIPAEDTIQVETSIELE